MAHQATLHHSSDSRADACSAAGLSSRRVPGKWYPFCSSIAVAAVQGTGQSSEDMETKVPMVLLETPYLVQIMRILS